MADDHGVPQRTPYNQSMVNTDHLGAHNAAYLEAMQAEFLANKGKFGAEWQSTFGVDATPAHTPSWKPDSVDNTISEETAALDGNWDATPEAIKKAVADRKPTDISADGLSRAVEDTLGAIMMIRAYRVRGHLAANLDPLGLTDFGDQPELDPASYGFGEADMDREIFINYYLGLEYATPRQMVELLRRTYCETIGVEFQHISDPLEKSWLQERIEGPDKGVAFSVAGKKAILAKLIEAESFEKFLHKRYPGTKRFGLDGGEATVPALEQIIKRGGALGIDEIVIGMAHRGRLNMLGAVMGKPYAQLFHEFKGGSTQGAEDFGSGDVKYHLGASSDRVFDDNEVHLTMNANPSHLEAVSPVVLGRTRAKQNRQHLEFDALDRSKKLPLLLHGDAAFAGQGVVSECFALSGLSGYRTGGTIHFIINNQIGFTTSPMYSRSSPYPSDVALMVQAPIFHVNGDDPEAVVYAARVATEYRQKFGKDVVIDMFCYRRFGHNEGDEPMFTQPLMYKKIKSHPPTAKIYADRLVAEGVLTQEEVDREVAQFAEFLDTQFNKADEVQVTKADWLGGEWEGLGLPHDDKRRGETGVSEARLKTLMTRLTTVPEGTKIHRTLERVIKARAETVETGKDLDWASGEHLAFATLMDEGFPVRLSGQDCARGTFSHRHSHFVDQNSGDRYTPLNDLGDEAAPYEVIDSLLSEEAVLGYEYGYSLADPNTLTIWEAQFGDFANGAQVFFDQFISSAERKWLRMSGLVCLLPHGYEGQGPEHSSARLERFLQMCAEDNMQICNITTPANYFHALRRQIHRDFRKPLIVMTPKSLLRHPMAKSDLSEMGPGQSFHRLLWDSADPRTPVKLDLQIKGLSDVRRVIVCSGKVYYDLLKEREERAEQTGADKTDIYLLRVEQFYPVPTDSLVEELAVYPDAELVWCQEEPRNMGGWHFIRDELEVAARRAGLKSPRPKYVGRAASAATATGLASKHKEELREFLNLAFGDKLIDDEIAARV